MINGFRNICFWFCLVYSASLLIKQNTVQYVSKWERFFIVSEQKKKQMNITCGFGLKCPTPASRCDNTSRGSNILTCKVVVFRPTRSWYDFISQWCSLFVHNAKFLKFSMLMYTEILFHQFQLTLKPYANRHDPISRLVHYAWKLRDIVCTFWVFICF